MTTEELKQWKAYLANLKAYERALTKWVKKQKDDGIQNDIGSDPPPPPPPPPGHK